MRKALTIAAAVALLVFLPQSGAAQPNQEKPDPPAKKAKGQTLDEMLLFFPAKHPKGNWEPKGLEFEDVSFQAEDGTKLHAWYCPCKKARAVLLYAHGNGGNLSYDARMLRYFQTELLVTVLIFDYRGYGKSEGAPTVDGVLQDARAARTALAKKADVKESEIVLMGRSLGGAVVCQLAGAAAPRGLVLENTFSSLKEVAEHHFGALAAIVPKDRLDSAAQLARYPGPLLQTHGDADKTVPFAMGKKLFEAHKGTKEFVQISGGQHNDPYTAAYREKLDKFIGALPRR